MAKAIQVFDVAPVALGLFCENLAKELAYRHDARVWSTVLIVNDETQKVFRSCHWVYPEVGPGVQKTRRLEMRDSVCFDQLKERLAQWKSKTRCACHGCTQNPEEV